MRFEPGRPEVRLRGEALELEVGDGLPSLADISRSQHAIRFIDRVRSLRDAGEEHAFTDIVEVRSRGWMRLAFGLVRDRDADLRVSGAQGFATRTGLVPTWRWRDFPGLAHGDAQRWAGGR